MQNTQEEQEKRKESAQEGEEEVEQYTLEELCGNTWDSLARFNELFEVLLNNMNEYK